MEITPATQHKFDQLTALGRIERHHLDILTSDEREVFLQMLHNKVPTLSGHQFDTFVEQTKALLNQEEIWEFNHAKIGAIMERYVRKNGILPTVAAIVYETKLSRKTVANHLNAFTGSVTLKNQKHAMAVMMPRVIGKILQKAMEGDIKAARLYYDMVSGAQKPETPASKQNNYIQINNTLINQQVIQQLEPEQLQQIEQIITRATTKLNP